MQQNRRLRYINARFNFLTVRILYELYIVVIHVKGNSLLHTDNDCGHIFIKNNWSIIQSAYNMCIHEQIARVPV